jgi:glucosylglycerate synthase
MTPSPVIAILPSRDEADTIAAVTRAVDAALDDDRALIVHADSSTTPATAAAFRATATRARTVCLTGLPTGKGAQILHALGHHGQECTVLLADTDTRNPDPATYRALLDTVAEGAVMALADYPRYWDEANLTNHVARALIAVATGHDVPQPLAGDLALSITAIRAVPERYHALPAQLARCVEGYGIDAFLLHTAARAAEPIVPVRLASPKHHAPSFPHLPVIFAEAVPVLLHPAVSGVTRAPEIGAFRLTNRELPARQLRQMLDRLQALRPAEGRYDQTAWPHALAAAWRAVASGLAAVTATQWLWPAYLDHVSIWLADTSAMAARAQTLRAAATELLVTLTTTPRESS